MSEDLVTWTKQYITQKDLFKKDIESMSAEDPWQLVAHTKKGKQCYHIVQQLDGDVLLPLLGADPVFVVLPNTKKNLQELIKHWKALKTYPKLCFIFVNPHSSTETKWLIYPYTHDRITEPATLNLGLKTLFETVEEIKN